MDHLLSKESSQDGSRIGREVLERGTLRGASSRVAARPTRHDGQAPPACIGSRRAGGSAVSPLGPPRFLLGRERLEAVLALLQRRRNERPTAGTLEAVTTTQPREGLGVDVHVLPSLDEEAVRAGFGSGVRPRGWRAVKLSLHVGRDRVHRLETPAARAPVFSCIEASTVPGRCAVTSATPRSRPQGGSSSQSRHSCFGTVCMNRMRVDEAKSGDRHIPPVVASSLDRRERPAGGGTLITLQNRTGFRQRLTGNAAARMISPRHAKEQIIMADTEATLALVTRFENEFNTRDVDALMADMTDDCVFEHIAPAHAGLGRHEGAAAVRAVWESMDVYFPGFTQEIVDVFTAGERACCRYVIRWKDVDGNDAALHGVDVITVRDGKIAQKLTYGTL